MRSMAQAPDSLAGLEKVRAFDAEKMEAYKTDRAFDYAEETKVETYSVWDHVLQFLNDLFRDDGNRMVLKVLMYIVCGGIMLVVILRLMGVNPRQLFYGNPSHQSMKGTITEEDIQRIDFESQISQAETEQNWKEAIRLQYLYVLKLFTDQGFITWKIDKTNHEYEIELQEDRLKQPFHRVTQVYEHVCYGNFEINEMRYQQFKGQFEEVRT